MYFRRLICTLAAAFAAAFVSFSQPQMQKTFSWSDAVATSFVDRFYDPDAIHSFKSGATVGSVNTVDWQPGYVMFAMEHVWRNTGDRRYFDYIRRYVDQHVDEEGNVRQFVPDALDHFASGYAVLFMYEQTGEEKYAKAAEKFRRGFDDYPRAANGMFYHGVRARQVWVDGVFMGQIFLLRYAKAMNHPEDYAEVVRQITGVSKICGRGDGLMVHAWAEPGKGRGWPGDGPSPEVWSEGLGWIAVLLADWSDWMPSDVAGYDDILDITKRLCAGLKGCQDSRTGLWSQVVDKPYEEGNWNETSGSGMFTYLLQRAIDKGFVPAEEYQSVVDKAYEGLLTKCVRNTDGYYNLLDCSSIGTKNSYREYVSQPHEVSTFCSFASFMLATGAVEWRRAHADASDPLNGTFYMCDYSQGKVMRFEDGRAVWKHDAPLTNDLWVLDNGNLLFTTGNGVLELNAAGDTVFSYSSASRIFAVQRLRNGNTFIGECTAGRLLEVSPKGKVVKSVNILPDGAKPDDGFIRNARRLDNGGYLVAHYSGRKVIEYDRKGNIVWQADIEGGAHSAARTPEGHTIVASTDKARDAKIIEFDGDGNIVWTLSNQDVPGYQLNFMSGFQYLPESDTFVLTNWQGHNVRRKGPHILWVSRDKKVLGTIGENADIQTASSIFIPLKTNSKAIH